MNALASVSEPADYRPSEDEPFMNERQLAYFKAKLEARPTATLSVEAQERHERRERVHRDD